MNRPSRPSAPLSTRRARLSRRAFLRSATLGTTIWLPALDAMFNENGTAYAQGQPLAKRFVEFFWGVSYSTVNGDKTWAPRSGSGPLPEQLPYYFNTDDKYQAKLKGLAEKGIDSLTLDHLTPSLGDPEIRKYIRIIDGITTSDVVKEANQHYQALLGVVTLPKNSEQYSGRPPKGPSLDRFIGSFEQFRGGIAPHVHLAVCPTGNYGGVSLDAEEHKASIDSAGMLNGQIKPDASYIRERAQWDPLLAFEEMFGSSIQTGEDPEARRQRSVLDGVLRASTPTLERLGAHDRQLVEAHLESIRQIEKNLVQTQSCTKPVAPRSARTERDGELVYAQDNSNRAAPRIAKDMRDIATLMLRCDYTRTLLFLVTPALSGFDGGTFLDFSAASGPRQVKSLHRDSHDAQPFHRLSTPWHMGQLAALIQALQAMPEGAGSALDNTLIWATSEHGPQTHSLENIATIVAGGPGLVAGNSYLHPGERRIADLHLGVIDALGLPQQGYLDYVNPPSPRPIDLLASA